MEKFLLTENRSTIFRDIREIFYNYTLRLKKSESNVSSNTENPETKCIR
jgi:hypothetical protein